jgi:two-component system invasion response regulator UvrY
LSMNIKVLIADDHPMTVKGLRLLVEHQIGKAMIREVGSCHKLMKELSANQFSHLILDIMLADGSALEVIPTIRSLYPELEIMIFSASPASLYRRALMRYRISYILSKSMSEKDTLQLLRKFLDDNRRVEHTGSNGDDPAAAREDTAPFWGMPAREIDVLNYLLKGWRTNEIAETLNLSVSTISTLKSRIFERTQTSNIKELMDLALMHRVMPD